VKDLTHQQQEMVFYYVREVLEEGIKYGGTNILDYRHAGGKNGEKQLHLYVYKQPGCKGGGRQNEKKNNATKNRKKKKKN
ncbi:formamidopyrimidine-DNA glycosylase, partial [Staphylococcus aureus]